MGSCIIRLLGGGFKHFLFCFLLLWEDSHFDKYFSKGLKPPTSLLLVHDITGAGKNGGHYHNTLYIYMAKNE